MSSWGDEFRRAFGKNQPRAFGRTGSLLSHNLEWILKFVAVPLEPLSKAELLQWCEDITVLTEAHIDGELLFRMEEGSVVHFHEPDDIQAWSCFIRECHTITRGALVTYITEGVARFPEMTIEPVVYRSGHECRATALGALDWHYEPEGALALAAYLRGRRNLYIDRLCSILEAEAKLDDGKGKLAVCNATGCRKFFKIFIKMKKGQVYCSDGCRTREAAKEKRRRDREQRRLGRLAGTKQKHRSVISNAVTRHISVPRP
jgi:hypothetical protein